VGSANETRQLAPLAKFDNSMVPKTQCISDVGDRNQGAVGSSSDVQQKLMLLRLQPCSRGGLLAKLQKSPNLVSKLGQ
jgi:hypothetical protein